MKMRKQGKGGRHVAMERGIRPGGSGWPFRRELRELASLRLDTRGRPTPPASGGQA